jgi:Na+/glutamate symporter
MCGNDYDANMITISCASGAVMGSTNVLPIQSLTSHMRKEASSVLVPVYSPGRRR